jgi:hypothetical protein
MLARTELSAEELGITEELRQALIHVRGQGLLEQRVTLEVEGFLL